MNDLIRKFNPDKQSIYAFCLQEAREMRQRINQRNTEFKTKEAQQLTEELRPKDFTAANPVMTPRLRREANALYECGLTLMEVADHLKVSYSTAWSAVSEKRPTNFVRRKLANSEVLEMRNEYLNGNSTVIDLAEKYDMSRTAVWRVISGQTYKELA